MIFGIFLVFVVIANAIRVEFDGPREDELAFRRWSLDTEPGQPISTSQWFARKENVVLETQVENEEAQVESEETQVESEEVNRVGNVCEGTEQCQLQ